MDHPRLLILCRRDLYLFTTFDILVRYLRSKGLRVVYQDNPPDCPAMGSRWVRADRVSCSFIAVSTVAWWEIGVTSADAGDHSRLHLVCRVPVSLRRPDVRAAAWPGSAAETGTMN